MKIFIGININDSREKWTDLILRGIKTIETRESKRLHSYVGKTVGLIQTGVGRAKLVGFIRIGNPIEYNTLHDFRRDVQYHLVTPGSHFDFKTKKYGYPIEVIHKLDNPIAVLSHGIVSRKIQPYEIHQE